MSTNESSENKKYAPSEMKQNNDIENVNNSIVPRKITQNQQYLNAHNGNSIDNREIDKQIDNRNGINDELKEDEIQIKSIN